MTPAKNKKTTGFILAKYWKFYTLKCSTTKSLKQKIEKNKISTRSKKNKKQFWGTGSRPRDHNYEKWGLKLIHQCKIPALPDTNHSCSYSYYSTQKFQCQCTEDNLNSKNTTDWESSLINYKMLIIKYQYLKNMEILSICISHRDSTDMHIIIKQNFPKIHQLTRFIKSIQERGELLSNF